MSHSDPATPRTIMSNQQIRTGLQFVGYAIFGAGAVVLTWYFASQPKIQKPDVTPPSLTTQPIAIGQPNNSHGEPLQGESIETELNRLRRENTTLKLQIETLQSELTKLTHQLEEAAPSTVFEYYPDGSKKSEQVVRGKVPDGPFTSYHPNGRKESAGEFTRGKRNGQWGRWNGQGDLLESGRYCGDRKIGEWTVRRDDGSYSTLITDENH